MCTTAETLSEIFYILLTRILLTGYLVRRYRIKGGSPGDLLEIGTSSDSRIDNITDTRSSKYPRVFSCMLFLFLFLFCYFISVKQGRAIIIAIPVS